MSWLNDLFSGSSGPAAVPGQTPKWGDALQIIGATLQDAQSGGKTNNIGQTSDALKAHQQFVMQALARQNLAQSLTGGGSPQPNPVNITPPVQTPGQNAGLDLGGSFSAPPPDMDSMKSALMRAALSGIDIAPFISAAKLGAVSPEQQRLAAKDKADATQVDFNTLDKGGDAIAEAMKPPNNDNPFAYGRGFRQAESLLPAYEQKQYMDSPEGKAQAAKLESEAKLPAEQQLIKDREASQVRTDAAKNQPFDADTINFMADQALAGDKSVLTQLGYGGAGQQNRAALRNAIAAKAKERNIGGAGLAALNAEFGGLQAGERTLGTRTANVEMAVTEAQQMMPLALEASDKVNRTQFPSLNSILQAGEKGVGDENVVRLGIATNSLINVYARAISPTGTPTVSDKDHARELLGQAWSKGQYKAGVDQLNKEMQAARKSPGQVRGEFRSAISGGAPGAAAVPDAPSKPAADPVIDNLLKKYGPK